MKFVWKALRKMIALHDDESFVQHSTQGRIGSVKRSIAQTREILLSDSRWKRKIWVEEFSLKKFSFWHFFMTKAFTIHFERSQILSRGPADGVRWYKRARLTKPIWLRFHTAFLSCHSRWQTNIIFLSFLAKILTKRKSFFQYDKNTRETLFMERSRKNSSWRRLFQPRPFVRW